MKRAHALMFLFLLPLGGCLQTFPGLNAGYQPIESELASMAAPTASSRTTLNCLVEKGTAKFSGGWNAFDNSAFQVTAGQRVKVLLSRPRSFERMSFLADFDSDGQKMVFCPLLLDAPAGSEIECFSIYALEEDWQHGLRRTLDVPQAVRGGQISCAAK